MANSKHFVKQDFHFRWYMAVLLIGSITVIGLVVLYISQASSVVFVGQENISGGQPVFGTGDQSKTIVARSLNTAQPVSVAQQLPTNTTQTLCAQLSGVAEGGTKLFVTNDVSTTEGGSGGSGELFVAQNGWVQLYTGDWAAEYSGEAPTANLVITVTGSNGSNLPAPNPTVQVTKFAVTSGGLACPSN